MTIGSGIFLSTILLSLVTIFVVTKDLWNWRRIAKWGLALPLAGALIIGAGVNLYEHLYERWEERLTAQTSFGRIALNAKKADVKFSRGEPTSTAGLDAWIYNAGTELAEPGAAKYFVRFREGRIRFVLYTANDAQIVHPQLMGFTIGTPHERVIEKLGQPSNVANSANDLDRMYSYQTYNVFFSFTQGKLVSSSR